MAPRTYDPSSPPSRGLSRTHPLPLPCREGMRVRQVDPHRRALTLLADDLEPAAVAQRDMLGDGEAEPGAADRAAAARVDAVEALGEAGQMLGRDALALVDDADA